MCRVVFTQGLIAIANLPLARQKDQHIAFAGCKEDFVHGFQHCIFDRYSVIAFIEEMLRAVSHLYRVGAT